ncbi:cytochrome P450 [Lentzea sp. NBRC 105346]|uniref:cytochrome P450 family protein n=1 Tax=Lentzea sp. NBRC 105346 TaxID=3032205 RepID=UPI0024A1400F|nr:cytochrome P450 [Lentzea sp. NBRC 105346]GLZ29792.1 cytochrome P450 [Lentzea sp. NBRC 105346]
MNRVALAFVSSDMALNLDALRPGFTEDPYSTLAGLRERGPVHQVEIFGMPMWLVTRYRDVKAALGDPLLSSHGSSASEATKALPMIQGGWFSEVSRHMLMSDPPDHGRLRRAVSREFTPRRIAALRPRIQELADTLLDLVIPAGKADLISSFAAPLPITVIMELLGVPDVDQENFRYWADVVTGVHEGDHELIPQVHAEAAGYLRDLVAHKRTSEEDDLIGALARVAGPDALTDDELVSLAFLLLVAGYTTTIDLIGNGTLALLRNPEQLELLREAPSMLPGAIEEFLRFDGPTSHATLRFAKPGLNIGGVEIPAGDLVLLSLASADHDPERFPRAEALNIERADRQHLAFGHGIHFCIGAPLARLEGEIAFRSLLARLPGLALDTSEPLDWRVSINIRGLKKLPVTFRQPVVPSVPLDEQKTVQVPKPKIGGSRT